MAFRSPSGSARISGIHRFFQDGLFCNGRSVSNEHEDWRKVAMDIRAAALVRRSNICLSPARGPWERAPPGVQLQGLGRWCGQEQPRPAVTLQGGCGQHWPRPLGATFGAAGPLPGRGLLIPMRTPRVPSAGRCPVSGAGAVGWALPCRSLDAP